MKAPKLPDNEHTRLEALRALNILDTPPEEHFDRVTRMAKRLFNVEISLVSLIDENRQWFKSCAGLEALETPRDISFCGHAILDDKTFIIEDASKDERFFDNPLVTGPPFIRFYAGQPLIMSNGDKLGTLCIIDSAPKCLTADDVLALKDLAGIVQDELSALQMATYDELTGISNRRGFIKLAKHSLKVGLRQNSEHFLAYFDLNDFKPINDNFGHEVGDNILRYFANQMKHTYRESDIYARLGGDEFVVLLTNTSQELAVDAIARFTDNLSKSLLNDKFPHAIPFSHGLIKYDETLHNDINQLIQEADKAMFKNKRKSCKS
jgi:diguanylate cyclase (GGDEF)-like protein